MNLWKQDVLKRWGFYPIKLNRLQNFRVDTTFVPKPQLIDGTFDSVMPLRCIPCSQ